MMKECHRFLPFFLMPSTRKGSKQLQKIKLKERQRLLSEIGFTQRTFTKYTTAQCKDVRLAPHKLRLAAINRIKISLSMGAQRTGSFSSENVVMNCAWPVEDWLSARLSTQILTKLPGLSESSSLSHRYCIKRMNVHPQKINSLSTISALNEFFGKTQIFNEY